MPSKPERLERTRQRDGAELRRIHPWIPKQTERALARFCVKHERDAGEVVAKALAAFIRDTEYEEWKKEQAAVHAGGWPWVPAEEGWYKFEDWKRALLNSLCDALGWGSTASMSQALSEVRRLARLDRGRAK